jgi:NAD+ synthase (glutamine-hydrolysing)
MRIALAQLNPAVGDIAGNAAAIAEAYRQGLADGADAVATGELGLTGYPPQDLVLKPAFVTKVAEELARLAEITTMAALVVGFVEDLTAADATQWRRVASEASLHSPLANAAAVLRNGRVEAVYRKSRIPNYGVFDEARYFSGGTQPLVVEIGEARVGVTVCEDLWQTEGAVAASAEAGAEVVLNINASPYHRRKRVEREAWARHHAQTHGVWLAYLNQVGGQDEVVFDGDSFVVDPPGAVVARGPQFATDTATVDLAAGQPLHSQHAADSPRLSAEAEVWAAVVCGTRDYARGNGFRRALVGLSGGIDSAATAVVAAEALGSEAVTGIAMPSPYSSTESLEDARALAANLGIRLLELDIAEVMAAFDAALTEPFAGTEPGVAEENLQSRIRGALLMAISNKWGNILLATGNKSEYAVGYATLYGDMAGGFAPLKDVPKTLVYDLAHFVNAEAGSGEVVPQSVIDKPPSAELRPDQRDTDSLPDYGTLDPILAAYVEEYRSVEQIAARGYDEALVRRVTNLVDAAEYKRQQAAPGVKISTRAFGSDRRLPITQAWRA